MDTGRKSAQTVALHRMEGGYFPPDPQGIPLGDSHPRALPAWVITQIGVLIKSLPTRQRETIRASLAGIPEATMAKGLGISRQAVHSLRQKALAKLKTRIEALAVLHPAFAREIGLDFSTA